MVATSGTRDLLSGNWGVGRMSLYDRVFLTEMDQARRLAQRAASSGDIQALERYQHIQGRSGDYPAQARTLKQIAKVKGQETAAQRGRIKARAVRKWAKGSIEQTRDEDERRIRTARRHAEPHVQRITTAWNYGRWDGLHSDPEVRNRKVNKAIHNIHRVADKHTVYPHDLFPIDTDMDDEARGQDVEMMSRLYKARQHKEDSGDYEDRHPYSGVATFDKKQHADWFTTAIDDRHPDIREQDPRLLGLSSPSSGGYRVKKGRGGTWEVHYGLGGRGRRW